MDDIITIPMAEYERLLDKACKLDALIMGGVDNWEYYDDALEQYYSEND